MDGSIVLVGGQRKRLLELYRREPDPAVRLRAHLILLLADGYAWSLIAAVLFCSTATIARWKERFESGGVAVLLEEKRGRKESAAGPVRIWAAMVVRWTLKLTPSFFGLVRSRWSCEALVLVLLETYQVQVSRETVRRWLSAEQIVWRRPRPILGPKDPQRPRKLRELRELLGNLPPNHAAVFQDEVDVNSNPKIGCMWMPKGKQAKVITPGTNEKKYIAGSLDWRSGKLTATCGDRRNAELFIAHLDDLRRRYRHCRVIHVVCDNARFHTAQGSKLVREYQKKWKDRIVLHYLPAYSPDTNPIERVWWRMHERVTRNHRCLDVDDLLDMVFQWLQEQKTFNTESRFYAKAKAA
jgi:putative transposase